MDSERAYKRSNRASDEESEIVERVNQLPLDEFASRYIPKGVLDQKFPGARPKGSLENYAESKGEPRSPEEEEKLAAENGRPTTYSLSFYSPETIPSPYFEGCFSLIEYTSSSAYKASRSFSWSPRKKKDEMISADMLYLVLVRDDSSEREKSEQGQQSTHVETEEIRGRGRRGGSKYQPPTSNLNDDIGGFISFMSTYEDSLPVLYVYEIHLHPCLRNRGIGKVLMQALEDIARNIGALRKTMLTVLRCNEDGMRFYERLGYREDEFSPPPRKLRGGQLKEWDYLIMSKDIN